MEIAFNLPILLIKLKIWNFYWCHRIRFPLLKKPLASSSFLLINEAISFFPPKSQRIWNNVSLIFREVQIDLFRSIPFLAFSLSNSFLAASVCQMLTSPLCSCSSRNSSSSFSVSFDPWMRRGRGVLKMRLCLLFVRHALSLARGSRRRA